MSKLSSAPMPATAGGGAVANARADTRTNTEGFLLIMCEFLSNARA